VSDTILHWQTDQPTNPASPYRRDQIKNRPQAVRRSSKPVPEQHPREPIGAPGVRVTGAKPVERPAFKSRLSPLAKRFAAIEVDDYAHCRDFIAQEKEILDEDEKDFVRDAAYALASSHPQRVPYARRCIQQSLILRHCKQRDNRGREKFFARLVDEEGKTAVDFLKESGDVLNACQEMAQQIQDATSERQFTKLAAAEAGAHKAGPTSRHAPRVEDLSGEVSALNLDSSIRQRYTQPEENARPKPILSIASETQEERYRRSSIASAAGHSHLTANINQGGLLRPKKGTHIKGSNGQQEELDASYFRRERAVQFFVIGRVFAVLWHEPAGDSQNDRFSEAFPHPGRFNEPIISHIRRMVVVKQHHGSCWAIPINTYKGQGVAKRGFNQYDIAGHAVIHATGREPYTDPAEPKMSKTPLKVNMVKDETLDWMSRVNFTTVHTVQHNVKVKNIGMVHKDSIGQLAAYWSAQMAA
jgi:hypothetical protein